MKANTFKSLWVSTQVLLFIIPLILLLWYTPYTISHDQHMNDTVNERALSFEPSNQTITDFTQAEIYDNDAQLEYEERAWMLENQELYWYGAIFMGLVYGILMQVLNLMWMIMWSDAEFIEHKSDEEDDDEFKFDERTPIGRKEKR